MCGEGGRGKGKGRSEKGKGARDRKFGGSVGMASRRLTTRIHSHGLDYLEVCALLLMGIKEMCSLESLLLENRWRRE